MASSSADEFPRDVMVSFEASNGHFTDLLGMEKVVHEMSYRLTIGLISAFSTFIFMPYQTTCPQVLYYQ
jgi:hypothetical protein